MIEKITVENLCIEDCNNYPRTLLENQVILDSRNTYSIYQEEDFPGINLLDRLSHRRYIDERLFGVSRGSNGYGYIEIEFTRPCFPDTHFKYVQQFMDSIPYFETLALGKSILAINQEGDMFCENNSYDVKIFSNSILARYYILNSQPECSWLREGFCDIVYKDMCNLNACDLRILKSWYGITVDELLEIYNKYLRVLEFDKHITLRYDSYLPTKRLNDFIIHNKSGGIDYQFPLSSEGGGFFRILNTIDSIEEAKYFGHPLIIRNFGCGIDKDRVDILQDIIKNESGKSIPYSILVV